jgi:hypothetical protein
MKHILRRAAIVMEFERPDEEERKELFVKTLDGTLNDAELKELAIMTGLKKIMG